MERLTIKSVVAHSRLVVVALVWVVGLSTTPLFAADESSRPPKPEAGQSQEKQCNWECMKWTKLCNVDPRGVYKCRRSCAKFGEVCE